MDEILIVDDERVMREGLKATLQAEGLAVRTARDGADALVKIGEKAPDLVLLDVMMPKMNGFRCCEEIRKTHVLLPVLFLTAKESETDQLRGIGLGADDYISKTVSDAVLLARIRRALCRTRQTAEARTPQHVIRLGRVTVDMKSLAVSENGREIAVLTRTEADILNILSLRAGERLAPEELVTELHGRGYAYEDASVYTHVYRLRRKLGSAGARVSNMRGSGYSLSW